MVEVKILTIAVLIRIYFLKGWPGLAWAGLGCPNWTPGSPWMLEVKILTIAVLIRIDFLKGWPGLAWPGLAWEAPNGPLEAPGCSK